MNGEMFFPRNKLKNLQMLCRKDYSNDSSGLNEKSYIRNKFNLVQNKNFKG
jgi:hypothetical protein